MLPQVFGKDSSLQLQSHQAIPNEATEKKLWRDPRKCLRVSFDENHWLHAAGENKKYGEPEAIHRIQTKETTKNFYCAPSASALLMA